MYNAIQKYGWDNFDHIIFAENLEEQEAKHIEILLIALYKSNVRRWGKESEGYNETDGGDGSLGFKHTENTKIYLSTLHSIPIVQLDLQGTFIAEHSSMINASKTIGCHVSGISDCCNNILNTYCGYIWALKSDYETGNYSIVKKMKERKPLKGVAVEQYDINGKLVDKYMSIASAARKNNINRSSIRDCCRGKQKTAGGFIWKCADDNIILNTENIQIPIRYNLTINSVMLSARQWSKKLMIQEDTIYGYIKNYGKSKTKELIEAMLKDPPSNKKRLGGQSWFEVYDINPTQ